MIRRIVTILMLMHFLLPCSPTNGQEAFPSEKQLPSLDELDLRTPGGERIYLTHFIGRKAVVVVFWATWCPLCRDEVPLLKKLDSNPLVKVIAINEEESTRKVSRFVADNHIGYQVVLDPNATAARALGVPGLPYCVIFGTSGSIAYRGSGLPENVEQHLLK